MGRRRESRALRTGVSPEPAVSLRGSVVMFSAHFFRIWKLVLAFTTILAALVPVPRAAADSTETTGSFTGASFTGPTNFAAGRFSISVAVGDFNGDSDPDLAVANHFSDNVSILPGNAGGSFTN